MTLREHLSQLSPNDFVYIGADNAFFFIGKVKDIDKELPEVIGEYRRTVESLLFKARRDLDRALNLLPTELPLQIESCRESLAYEKDGARILRLRDRLLHAERRLEGLPKEVRNLRRYISGLEVQLNESMRPMDAQVREAYPRQFDPPYGTIFLLDSKMPSIKSYWSYQEYLDKEAIIE